MQRRTILTGTALGVAGATLPVIRPAESNPRTAEPELVAIRDVTVIDAREGTRRAQNVLVRGDRILDAGPIHRVPVPCGATTVDGTGKYLIPGLADMHTHAVGIDDTDPELYVVNGVTTTRQMSGGAQARTWQRQVAAGTRLGPQWSIGSRIIDGAPSLWDGLDSDGSAHVSVAGAREARAAVRTEHAAGAAFIKTYTRLTRESFLAVAHESGEVGLPFLGHVPDFVSLTEASDRGMLSIEHLFEIWYDTSAEEQRLRAAVAAVPVGPGDYNGWFNRMRPQALGAATLNPAGYLGRHDAGFIARGAVADLVLLEADPLRDIAHTAAINSVLVRGHLIGPTQRRQILADIATRARQPAPPTSGPTAYRGCPCHGTAWRNVAA